MQVCCLLFQFFSINVCAFKTILKFSSMFLAKDGDVDDHWIWFLLENGHDWAFPLLGSRVSRQDFEF